MKIKSKNITQQTKESYNLIASHFSQKRRFLWPEMKKASSLVKAGDRVLDLGCGNGRLYQAFAGKKVRYLGIDFSKELLKIARKSYPQAKFFLADITKRKTYQKMGEFNICFCIAVLHHISSRSSQLKIFENVYKVLKKEGILILSVWNLYQEKYKKHFKNERQKKVVVPYKISNGEKIVGQTDRYLYAFKKQELEKIAKEAGFKIKACYYDWRGKRTDWRKGANLFLIAKK